MKGRAVGLHEDRQLARARRAFTQWAADPFIRKRQQEIDRLPKVQWKGKTLHTIRCRADFGKGPHDVNVPESMLWALLDLQHFRCPYHR